MEGIRATGTTHQNIPAQERLSADEQWNREVSLDLVPHPSHPHPTSIEHDFGMQDGKLTVTLRAAVAGYVLWQWQVDCSPDVKLPLKLGVLSFVQNVDKELRNGDKASASGVHAGI